MTDLKNINSLSLDKLQILIDVSAKINSNYSDLNALLIYILESAMLLVECESASLLLVDKETNILRFAVALGPKGAEVMNIPVQYDSIAGWVVKNNSPLIVNDVANDPRFFDKVQEKSGYVTKNMIAIPMRLENECFGVIELLNKKEQRLFTETDLAMLDILSVQAVVAYKNASVFQSAQNVISNLKDSLLLSNEYHKFVSKSPAILELLRVVKEVADTNSSVLIMGESGVGKELFAEQLHLNSNRRCKPFVRVNCAALSPTLLESELFGHVRGAFTDAVAMQKGRFETADGGTIFLDEIGELPLSVQSKLLRVIQSRQFERVGSSQTISVDVRIVAATNRDLEEMVRQGTFRSDLYYRLNVLPLTVPPLRDRKEDIMPLALFFMKKFNDETKKNFVGFSENALNALLNYYWPGNIRELENSVERACVLGTPPYIQEEDLRIKGGATQNTAVVAGTAANQISDFATGDDRSLKNAVDKFKKAYIKQILIETNWNQTKTAKILRIQRTYVSRLLNELHIRDEK